MNTNDYKFYQEGYQDFILTLILNGITFLFRFRHITYFKTNSLIYNMITFKNYFKYILF